ncbi:MAG: Arm DNA-binding domain-containing protein, partial [Petrimonas sp.]|nr:Arm DNA-binding domain-containing protein [Petrimonas sp.]
MEKATFSVSYFLRLNKLYRNGEAPLLVRITYNGQRTEFTSNHRVKPEFWDQKSNKALGKTAYAKKVNGF